MNTFFKATNSFETEVEKATSEKNTTELWDVILDICDKAGKSSDDAKACLRAIYKRLNNSDPHIQVQAVTLLDACVSNCGKVFHIEIASREFENEFTKLLKKCHPTVQQKLKESLKKWAEGEFKSDPQLNLVPSLYNKLKSSGTDFTVEMPTKKTIPLSKDPNVVQSAEEEEQIAKAIELSLKETSSSPRSTTSAATSSSLYPTANLASAALASSSTAPPKELRKVRALYDFEAAEDNELTFTAGEITAEKNKKLVQFSDYVEVKNVDSEPQEVEINEEKIDRLLHLLHDADTTNPENDDEEMLRLEREANAMGPLIDSELEQVDRKHAQLTKLSTDLVDALSLYHSLMREPQFQPVNKMYNQFPPNSQPPTGMYHNGSLPPNTSMPPQFMIGQPVNIPPGQQDTHMGQVSLPPQQQSMMGPPPGMMLPPHFIYGESRGGPMPQFGHMNPGLPPGQTAGPNSNVFTGGVPPQQQQQQQQTIQQQGSLTRFPQGLPPNFGPQSVPPGYGPGVSIPSAGSQTVLPSTSSSKQLPGQYASASSTHLM
ncbi:signal transducing adapter molecule 1 isoform X2 [Agrilus planipennis]|uniref:Signal transducing adapter molecule 1 isoform X2 n=1 Tax=Agrilus planipennis TaxID=224129 RepID=A0A7F5R478_AGRPL|nr:signal transducing adapter molecule 1 isoform X2 [Agrilus planipennis]